MGFNDNNFSRVSVWVGVQGMPQLEGIQFRLEYAANTARRILLCVSDGGFQ